MKEIYWRLATGVFRSQRQSWLSLADDRRGDPLFKRWDEVEQMLPQLSSDNVPDDSVHALVNPALSHTAGYSILRTQVEEERAK